jgi:hypothetical protein
LVKFRSTDQTIAIEIQPGELLAHALRLLGREDLLGFRPSDDADAHGVVSGKASSPDGHEFAQANLAVAIQVVLLPGLL